MTVLRDVSAIWSFLHTLVIFYILFESRFTKKKTNTIIFSTMLPLIAINFGIFLYVGPEIFGTLLLLTCTVPSLAVFWYLAKNRDGRFLFTFCMVDSLVLDILFATQILNFFTTPETFIVIFFSRIIIFPVLEVYFYKIVRPIYVEIQANIKKGWYIFSGISAIFYILIALSISYPSAVTSRPEYIPAAVLLLILIPLVYLHIFRTLISQQEMHEMEQQENILKLQATNLKSRIEEFSLAEEKFRIERHDIRHKFQTIESLAENKEYDKLLDYLGSCDKSISETKIKHYCSNAVIDAVLSAYIQKAESNMIKVSSSVDLPEVLPANEAEIATVLANAIENAVNAAKNLPEQKRFIDIKSIVSPQFMIQISNSFDGNIIIDDNGIPQSEQNGHGFGIRSIIAFCEKYGAFYEFKTNENVFIFRIMF